MAPLKIYYFPFMERYSSNKVYRPNDIRCIGSWIIMTWPPGGISRRNIKKLYIDVVSLLNSNNCFSLFSFPNHLVPDIEIRQDTLLKHLSLRRATAIDQINVFRLITTKRHASLFMKNSLIAFSWHSNSNIFFSN